MKFAVFVGPTLAATRFEADDLAIFPPVAQGDVFRVAQQRPRAIGIVDGYFSGKPAVWHKEILWAISNGIPVFGAASMGALRAAELCHFGMRGIGAIFEAYRDGALEDDDEVAMQHGPAELGYLLASEPMVNIRATLVRAEAEGVLSADSRMRLEHYAKSLFFAERNWPAVLDAAGRLSIAAAERQALEAWLPSGRVDQKRLDALEMIAAMRAIDDLNPSRPDFHFEWTYLWDSFVSGEASAPTRISSEEERILDELRLEGLESYRRAETPALLRAFIASGLAHPTQASRQAASATLAGLRDRFGLYLRADLDRWMAANDLEPTDLEAMIGEETRVEGLRLRLQGRLNRYLLDELKFNGRYPGLAQRAREKEKALSREAPAGGPAELGKLAPRLWYFEQRLKRSLPENPGSYVARFGFDDAAALERAIEREWLFAASRSNDLDGM